jgi:hypothetical protein
MAAGTAASASAGGSSGGVGGNLPFMGGGFGGAIDYMRQNIMNKNKATASATARAGAKGIGGGMGKRMGSIESRLDALEGGGGDGVAAVGIGGAPNTPLAEVTSGVMPESPGSLSEAMPAPAGASMDMFGSEFARSAAVGAARMRINKKI